MSQIECGRGHLYDPDQYPACPYCNGRSLRPMELMPPRTV